MGKRNLLGFFVILPAFLAAVSIVLICKMLATGILPAWALVIFMVLIALYVVFNVFVIIKKKKVATIIFSIITVLLVAVATYGTVAFMKVTKTLDNISVSETHESMKISVIALKDSGYTNVSDLSGKKIALCDEEESKQMASIICDSLSSKPSLIKGTSDMDIIDYLIIRKVDAAIINDAYLDVVSGFEGYENFADWIVVLETSEIEIADSTSSDYVETSINYDEELSALDDETISELSSNGELDLSSMRDSNYSTEVSGNTKPTVTVNTGGIANSATGAHTTNLNWGDDIVTSGENTFIAYVSGIDTLGSVDVKRRSDVNILAAVNRSTGTIQLIDTPRDYFVILPQVGQADKLTHAGIYGIDYSIAALENLYGIKVDYYLRMNFTGFVKMIDTIGGVDVYSDYEFTVEPVKTYTVGVNHLNGIEALAFARERYSFSSGDIQRGKNQMKVIDGLVQKLSSPEIVINYAGILGCISDSFQTNMPTDMMYQIISSQITSGAKWNINSKVSSGFGASSTTYSGPTKVGYVMTPNDDDVAAAHELIKSVVGN